MRDRIYLLLASVFGIGYLPWMPGTWTSLAALVLWWPLLQRPWVLAACLTALFFLGVFLCDQAERIVGKKDPRFASIDELLGMGIPLVFLPGPEPGLRPYFALMAFILFRLFDIWKPYPIRRIENLPGGWGIMTDDLVAGLYASFFLQVGALVVRVIA